MGAQAICIIPPVITEAIDHSWCERLSFSGLVAPHPCWLPPPAPWVQILGLCERPCYLSLLSCLLICERSMWLNSLGAGMIHKLCLCSILHAKHTFPSLLFCDLRQLCDAESCPLCPVPEAIVHACFGIKRSPHYTLPGSLEEGGRAAVGCSDGMLDAGGNSSVWVALTSLTRLPSGSCTWPTLLCRAPTPAHPPRAMMSVALTKVEVLVLEKYELTMLGHEFSLCQRQHIRRRPTLRRLW